MDVYGVNQALTHNVACAKVCTQLPRRRATMKFSKCMRSSAVSVLSVLATLLVASTQVQAQKTGSFAFEELDRLTIHRRAVDAVIWGFPLTTCHKRQFHRSSRTTKISWQRCVWTALDTPICSSPRSNCAVRPKC